VKNMSKKMRMRKRKTENASSLDANSAYVKTPEKYPRSASATLNKVPVDKPAAAQARQYDRYRYVVSDLKRIFTIAVPLFLALIILSFFLHV
jgi:hypothetical protein